MKLLIICCSFFIMASISTTIFAQSEIADVWEPQVAGRFYPASEVALKDQINAFFKNVPQQSVKGKPFAIIAPHAGYQYSGQVGAYGYSAIIGCEFNRVVILSASHFMSGKRFRGVSVLKVKNFKTPFGNIPVDQDACDKLLSTPDETLASAPRNTIKLFGSFEGAYKGEHSLETQLPFLQMSLGNFKLVPLIIGILTEDDFDKIANVIKPIIDDKTIIVISSDFTHYGEGYGYVPFKNDIEKNIRALDYGAFNKIITKDFEGLRVYRKETGINACGIIPISLLLKLLPNDAQGEILKYDTSGHQANNFSFSVSYASILFTRPEIKSGQYIPGTKSTDNNSTFQLNNEEKRTLLAIARNTLEAYTKNGNYPKINTEDAAITPRLKENYGVFVTLKKHGELRGCVGYIVPKTSLLQAVIENTINSSSYDGRFSPVEAQEISDISIEISVLSPIKNIQGPDDFVVGREGILIKRGPASAVFLPQVATEQGWSKNETLSHLCRKAGLSTDAWKSSGLEYFVFTAEVFHEPQKL